MRRQILTAKSGISNHAAAGIFDDPCLSKFGALRGSCPHPGRQFVGLLCVSLMAPLKKHNRAKPLFESASALFSIADAGEFGSRGFILSVKRCH